MKFKFSLEKILNLKKQEEQQQLMVLSQWQAKLMDEEAALAQLHASYNNYSVQLSQKQTFLATEYRLYADYFPVLQANIKRQIETCSQIEEQLQEQRTILVDLIKERKMLEKLKEKKFKQAILEHNQEEQKALDEMALNTFFR